MSGTNVVLTLQILPWFFSNCIFLAIYDATTLVRRFAARLLLLEGRQETQATPRMLTKKGVRAVWRSYVLDLTKAVRLGGKAPNARVVPVKAPCHSQPHHCSDTLNYHEQQQRRLLDFARAGRPLVINFGSAS